MNSSKGPSTYLPITLNTDHMVVFNLKRRSRTRTKQELTSPSKAKPLHILPEVTEEDEGRLSTSSSSYSPRSYSPVLDIRGSVSLNGRPAKDAAERKRGSRRVVLTGAEGLTFEDFFPVGDAPLRPTSQSPLTNQAELRFSGLGVDIAFPSPPRKQRREQSPTPSVSSSTDASDSSASSSQSPSTPPTSDDESRPQCHLARAPTFKSQRASIIYTKSISDVQKPRPPQIIVPDPEEVGDYSDAEDASWIAEDISEIFTLSSPYPPSFPSTPTSASLSSCDFRVRPDSIPPPPRRPNAAIRSRHSKPLPVVPRLSIKPVAHGPSVQLDPTFHNMDRQRRSISSHPPVPPIIIDRCSSPTMEEETDELLALLANAALGSGFLGTGLSSSGEDMFPTPVTPISIFAIGTPTALRPPPRMSVPADVFDLLEDVPSTPTTNTQDGAELFINNSDYDIPTTPQSISIYSQPSMSVDQFTPSSFDFTLEEVMGAKETTAATPESPFGGMYPSLSTPTLSSSSSAFPTSSTSPFDSSVPHHTPERILRSRWSSSTLASTCDQAQSPSSWMVRFRIGSGSPSSKKSSSPKKPSTSKHTKSSSNSSVKQVKEESELERKVSRKSLDSDSGESTSSNGLRRKPIPLEIFLR